MSMPALPDQVPAGFAAQVARALSDGRFDDAEVVDLRSAASRQGVDGQTVLDTIDALEGGERGRQAKLAYMLPTSAAMAPPGTERLGAPPPATVATPYGPQDAFERLPKPLQTFLLHRVARDEGESTLSFNDVKLLMNQVRLGRLHPEQLRLALEFLSPPVADASGEIYSPAVRQLETQSKDAQQALAQDLKRR